MGILRNLWRRKVRTVLTVAGIVMGIFALTTMGALAEHFNVLLGGGITYYGSSIQVASDTGGGSFGGGYMSLDTVNKIKMIDGVRAVGPAVQVLAKPGSISAVNFGVPDYVMNYDPASFKYSAFKVTLADGQWTTELISVPSHARFIVRGRVQQACWRRDQPAGSSQGCHGGLRQSSVHGDRHPRQDADGA